MREPGRDSFFLKVISPKPFAGLHQHSYRSWPEGGENGGCIRELKEGLSKSDITFVREEKEGVVF